MDAFTWPHHPETGRDAACTAGCRSPAARAPPLAPLRAGNVLAPQQHYEMRVRMRVLMHLMLRHRRHRRHHPRQRKPARGPTGFGADEEVALEEDGGDSFMASAPTDATHSIPEGRQPPVTVGMTTPKEEAVAGARAFWKRDTGDQAGASSSLTSADLTSVRAKRFACNILAARKASQEMRQAAPRHMLASKTFGAETGSA